MVEIVTNTERIAKTLTHTEMAIIQLLGEYFKDRDTAELVMSGIADKVKFSRSNFVTLLSKLTAAGVLDTRSLGMKGTFIKVINRQAFDELVREVS